MEEEASARARKGPREGDTVTSGAAAGDGGRQHSPYQPIAATLKVSRDPVCLFAVVAEIGASVMSGGTDFTVTLRIADESRKAGVTATFFAKKEAQLPRVNSTGDVISLHDVKIQPYGESDFFVVFNKKFSSFALFESNVSAGCKPYQTFSYHGSKHDKELLTHMRTWLGRLPNNSLGLKNLELQLMSLKSDSTFDLVCKVYHVLQHNGEWIFYVWDGTDTPAAEFHTISDAEEVASPLKSPPLLEGPPLPRKVLCTMPCVGTIMRIFSGSCFNKNKIGHMGKGIYWARFCNITCKQESGIWKGIFSNSSFVRLLSQKDGSVVDRLKMYGRRNAKKVHRQPMASFPSNVTDLDEEDKNDAYATLMNSLTYKKVTHVVKTLVRVVAAYPCRASEVRLLSPGDYTILLTLEDPTARIHAFVPKNELVKFFGGFPTEELVIKKMNKLLGVPEAEDSKEVAPLTRNPPWIRCCLKSYYTQENDPWGSRRYQIYGTTIRD